jgi:hypothetical protein
MYCVIKKAQTVCVTSSDTYIYHMALDIIWDTAALTAKCHINATLTKITVLV